MRLAFAALLLVSVAGCQSVPTATKSAHGDGSSPNLAVDLSSAHTEFEGIRAEKEWINEHYPGATVKSQSLLIGPPMMDMLEIDLPSGETKKIYFDISSYFGKL